METKRATSAKSSTTVAVVANPILFVTQVPTAGEIFASRTSIFANHRPEIESVPRGGDLMIRYPDGTVKNLTALAGFGQNGQQGANAIAVRDPSVHWSGNKALFSMVIGAPVSQYVQVDTRWQLYEVSGLGKTDTLVIAKVPGQPAYNNVTPLYDTNDNILLTSDRPRDGAAHLYPQLDEYESTSTITGLWRLDTTTQALRLLNHTPSGLFSPTIDSFVASSSRVGITFSETSKATARRPTGSFPLPMSTRPWALRRGRIPRCSRSRD